MSNSNLSDDERKMRNRLNYLSDKIFRYINIEELLVIKFFKPAVIAFMHEPLSVPSVDTYERIEFNETLELCDTFLSDLHFGLHEIFMFLRDVNNGIYPNSDHTMAYPIYRMIKLATKNNFIDTANLMHENAHMLLEWNVWPGILEEIAPIAVETLAVQFLIGQNKKTEQIQPIRIKQLNENTNYMYAVISLIEMFEFAEINISENGLDNDSREKLSRVSLPENKLAFLDGLIKLEEILTDLGLKNKRSLNLNHYIGTIIGVFLAEQIKNEEIDLDMIFNILLNRKLDYKQKLTNLGVTEETINMLVSNLYKYTETKINMGVDSFIEINPVLNK